MPRPLDLPRYERRYANYLDTALRFDGTAVAAYAVCTVVAWLLAPADFTVLRDSLVALAHPDAPHAALAQAGYAVAGGTLVYGVWRKRHFGLLLPLRDYPVALAGLALAIAPLLWSPADDGALGFGVLALAGAGFVVAAAGAALLAKTVRARALQLAAFTGLAVLLLAAIVGEPLGGTVANAFVVAACVWTVLLYNR